MNSLKIFIVFAIITNIFGCATKATHPGVPIWDYAKEGRALFWGYGTSDKAMKEYLIRQTEKSSKANQSSLGRAHMAFGIGSILGGTIQSQIPLEPNDLNAVITKALTENMPLIPTAAKTNKMKSTFSPHHQGGWGVSESHEGQITTDWMPIQGRIAGLLWWKKEYQSQVRHVVTIRRAYQSALLANFTILTEVRERPNPNYNWKEGDPELGRESFESIKAMLLKAIKKELLSKGVKQNEN